MERQPLILSVVAAGTPDFCRYRICDAYNRFWTGAEWSEPGEDHRGLMYADCNRACHEVQRLLMLEYMDRPCRVFRAPVEVRLFADRDISQQELKAWLLKCSKLLIDTPREGNGPCEGSLGLVSIHWNELAEVKEGKKRHRKADQTGDA